MTRSVWTRQRLLEQERCETIKILFFDLKSLKAEMDHDDWDAARRTARSIMLNATRMAEVESELETVTEMVDYWDRITKHMEKLEAQHDAANISK